MQIKLNCGNYCVVQAEISKPVTTEDGRLLFFANGRGISIRASAARDVHSKYGFVDKDKVTVYGKLRYSTKNDECKLIVTHINPTKGDDVNLAMIEGYPIEVSYIHDSALIKLKSLSVTKQGTVYNLYIPVLIHNQNVRVASIVGDNTDNYPIIRVDGKLDRYNDKPSILAKHIAGAAPIIREV